VICPKCGEDNSDNFRFCGMCGTLLETRLESRVESRRPAGAPVPGLPLPKMASTPDQTMPLVAQSPSSAASKPATSISGPSMLGLDQPGPFERSPYQPATQPMNQPTMDSLRERSFSGLDSFFEPEQPKTGGRRILLLVVLLAALGGAGWWTYTNYLGATESRKPEAAISNTGEASADSPSTKLSSNQPAVTQPAAKAAAQAPDAGSPQTSVLPVGPPQGQPEKANTGSDASQKTEDDAAKSEAKPLTPPVKPKIAPPDKTPANREPVTSVRASKLPVPGPVDSGDADFRKGEAYLYGRGAPENCDEAVKYLKVASAKSNAKARSAFGTMYATGHCAPRDLPTSYLWFAMALRVDPNNQILEKDLNAVWNQMTPPERQLATRMKQ